jgi:hypothetical protein
LKLLDGEMGQLGFVGQSSGCVSNRLILRLDKEAKAQETSVALPEFDPG